MRFFSKEKQDEFAYHLIGEKGTFLDMGCYHPCDGNNTQALELIGWTGILVDIRPRWVNMCKMMRKSPVFCVDVTKNSFTELLRENTETMVFDYVSIDTDEGSVGGLEQFLKNGFSFKCLTYEHDSYECGDSRKAPAMKILKEYGYFPIFEDVLTDGTDKPTLEAWEDWWINPKVFPSELLEIKKTNCYYGDCIKSLVDFKKKGLI
jgi:hypothetical protein